MRAWQGVETVEVDGVPVVVADEDAAFVAAGLTFRVGWADEPIARRGISHLVEHLAHAAIPSRAIEFNASVGPIETEFWARGRPDEVVGHLNAVVRALANPDLGELAREIGVLKAEGGMSTFRLLDRRFSNQGLGGRGWNEFVLETEDPALVRGWAAERFGRRAVVGWATGATPGLDLSPLGPGRSPSWPVVRRPTGWGPRRHLVWESTAVGWSGEVTTGWAGSAALELLVDRATTRLRHDLGASYGVEHGSMAIGPDARVRWLAADRGAGTSAVTVRDVLLADLDDLAGHGPSGSELDALRDRRLRVLEERDVAGWLATMGATELQQGRVPRDAEGVREEWEALQPEHVRAAAEELRSSLLLAVPVEARPSGDELPSIEPPSDTPLDGLAYRCHRRREGKLLDPASEVADLRIVPGVGVSSTEGGHTVAVPFADATVVIVIDELSVYVYDSADRYVEACVHDAQDRAAWLGAVEAAVGPDRVVRLRRGRDVALRRISELSGRQLAPRIRANVLAYVATNELRPFEEVVGIAAVRHDGDEGLVLLTPDRLVFRSKADTWWIDLHGVVSVEASEGLRGGRVRFVFEKGGLLLDRIRAGGRAAAIADHVRSASDRRVDEGGAGPAPRTDGPGAASSAP